MLSKGGYHGLLNILYF